jgi:hypothetical protein
MEENEEKEIKPKYYEVNREAWNKYQREYKKRRYNEDPEYRFRVKEYNRQRRERLKKNDF